MIGAVKARPTSPSSAHLTTAGNEDARLEAHQNAGAGAKSGNLDAHHAAFGDIVQREVFGRSVDEQRTSACPESWSATGYTAR